MLYGLSLLFGAAGSTLFGDIADNLRGGSDRPLVALAILFVMVGMAFKFSAIPFHFWAPDTYQGASLPVAAFLSVASKAAAVLALLQLVLVALPDADDVWAPVLWALAALTMTGGNLLALRQTDIVRLLAYSSIAQGGFLLVPIAVAGRYGGGADAAVEAVLEYLLIYAAANLGAFAVVIAVAHRSGGTDLSAYRGLFNSSPILAVLLTVFLLSLAGIPPLGGWFAKFAVLRAAVDGGTGWSLGLAAIAAVNTALGLVYYALVIRQMWTVDDRATADAEIDAPLERDVTHEPVSPALATALVLTTAVVVVTGVLPAVATHFGGLSSLAR